jgi:hypothetical protein
MIELACPTEPSAEREAAATTPAQKQYRGAGSACSPLAANAGQLHRFVWDGMQGGGITLFADGNFGGASKFFPPGGYLDLAALGFDNQMSSATISPGCTAYAYENTNFNAGLPGANLVITSDLASTGVLNDKASSLLVSCSCTQVWRWAAGGILPG